VQKLVQKAQELGIEIMYETPATEVLMEDGAVAGVKAVSKTANYTINAKAVIMCTGGFDANREMIDEYSPDASAAACQSSVGNTGDGIVMGIEAGADTVFKGGVIGFRAINADFPFTHPVNSLMWMPTLAVTDQGERFGNELIDYPIYFTNMVNSGADKFYLIFGPDMAEAAATAIGMRKGFEADTIEELAEAAGMDVDTFTETFNRYQELAEAGNDEDFGNPAIAPFPEEGPYYAVEMTKGTIGTMGGLKVDVDAQVIDTEGNPIPGFYAVGEVANGQFFDKEYPASGTMLSMSTTYGRTAGTNALEYAKQ
jgi:fumarate reductase flavoprotein subunit